MEEKAIEFIFASEFLKLKTNQKLKRKNQKNGELSTFSVVTITQLFT